MGVLEVTDANSLLFELSGALDGLATQVETMFGDDQSFLEMQGWTHPALNRLDLADLLRRPKARLLQAQALDISAADLNRLQALPSRIQYMRDQTIPNLNGNAWNVYLVILSLIEGLELILEKYVTAPFDVQALTDRRILPTAQLSRLRTLQKSIDRLDFESVDLSQKVEAIRSAHEVAEALPADVQALEDARQRYEAARAELAAMAERASLSELQIEAARERLSAADLEAAQVVKRANAAYAAATTVGLGKAFAERAASLTRSTIFLGVVLVAALTAGGFITFFRVQKVQALMLRPDVGFDVLWLNVTLTALSVSAPVWLAWIVTRQIGQRFRLAEDYSYKATVAKAYEGYRAEAASIDQELAKKLFGIALDRVGESPLRLVEKDSPGSPAHEVQAPIGRLFQRRVATVRSEEGA